MAVDQPRTARPTDSGQPPFSSGETRRRRHATAVEGPYGTFTKHAQLQPRALLVAAGIGVTALRSLLEDLPRASAPIVILRATRGCAWRSRPDRPGQGVGR
jgi:hypothetical protein